MKVIPMLVVMDNTIYTVLTPEGGLTANTIRVSDLVYDLSDETYVKVQGDKTLGDDTIKNLYKLSKVVTVGEFEYYMRQAFENSL